MQNKNIFCKLPVVISIAIMIVCTTGIIVAFDYHKIFETDALKVTRNTNNTQNDTTGDQKTVASLNTFDGINSTSNERHSTTSNTSSGEKPEPTVPPSMQTYEERGARQLSKHLWETKCYTWANMANVDSMGF